MAGVTNNSARQFNLKTVDNNGSRVTVRVQPGFNAVEDKHWEAFVSKDGKTVDPYVADLKKQGLLSFGKADDDKEFDEDKTVKAKSKSQQAPKTTKA